IDRADGRQALATPGAELRDDDHVDAVIEDGAELRGAVADARVAVDADRHVDHERSDLPLGVALVALQALRPVRCRHGRTRYRATLTRWSGRWCTWPVDDERRLTAQGLERKQQLLDCAARLFAERGYADTRVIDIVREAGVA